MEREALDGVLEFAGAPGIQDKVVEEGSYDDDEGVACGVAVCQVSGGRPGLVGDGREPAVADSLEGTHHAWVELQRACQDLLCLRRVEELGVAGELLFKPSLDPVVADGVDSLADLGGGGPVPAGGRGVEGRAAADGHRVKPGRGRR